MSFDLAGENPADLTLRVFRDGQEVADDLPGNTASWIDPDSNTASAASPCYTVEARYASGNHSQHAAPDCWWGPGSIVAYDAPSFDHVGGELVDNWGRLHYQGWGAPGDSLTVPSYTPGVSGRHLFQVDFGNGAGSVDTGITCAVKRLRVERVSDNALVGDGILVMPHLGTWDRWEDSNMISIDLQAGVEYRIVITDDDDTVNMSAFSHFEIYTGGLGGLSGEYDFVNISTLRVLAKP